MFGFLGPNGSSKSTTIGCMTGLLDPTSGQIEILGQPRSRRETLVIVGSPFGFEALTPGYRAADNFLRFLEFRRNNGGRVFFRRAIVLFHLLSESGAKFFATCFLPL
jgi:ABC-type multidrug transport system ATPase subunit